MATTTLNWTPCGSGSDGVNLYYGKTRIVTGTPTGGTGWILYTGAPLSPSLGTVTISGLDDNVEYSYYLYCHCPSAGNGPLVSFGPLIKYACPTVTTLSPLSNGLSYTLTVPPSANNSGTWIQVINVDILSADQSSIINAQQFATPFSSTISSSFSGLESSTSYNFRVYYTTQSPQTRISVCSITPFNTSIACAPATIIVNNPTATGFDVSWTPTSGGSFDILVNNNVIASGLGTGPYTVTGLTPNTNYTVNVRKNCTFGGTAMSPTQNITTSNNAILTFAFTNAGGSFLNFQASLDRPVDANININRVFADGFSSVGCSGGGVSSAQRNTVMTINAGASATGGSPDATSGTWSSASHYSMYNVIINGLAHINGDVITIGSYAVKIVIPSCN